MPVIFVYGIPAETERDELDDFSLELKEAVAKIPELNLNIRDITCFFPEDSAYIFGNHNLVIDVRYLFDKPERTDEVRLNLSKALVNVSRKRFPTSVLIECFITPFSPVSGFYASMLEN